MSDETVDEIDEVATDEPHHRTMAEIDGSMNRVALSDEELFAEVKRRAETSESFRDLIDTFDEGYEDNGAKEDTAEEPIAPPDPNAGNYE